MVNPAIYLNIVIGLILILLSIGTFFLLENWKEMINSEIQAKLDSYTVPAEEIDRIMISNYFKTKIKFYKHLLNLFTGLYGAGGVILGISLMVNSVLLFHEIGLENYLTYLIPSIFEILIIIILPYIYFMKIRPCKIP